MIKMKLEDLVTSYPAIERVMALKLPTKTAYQLSRIHSVLKSEVRLYEEQRGKLVEELGKPVEKQPGQFEIPPDKVKELNARLKEMLSVELEVPREPIKLDALNGVEIAPADLLACEKFILE